MSIIKGLISHLEQEINWIEQLISTLSAEKIVLATRQFDQLEDLAEQKQDLTVKLEASAQQRTELMGNQKLSTLLQHSSGEETQQISKLNDKLAEKLMQCRDLNTVNGQVIATNIHTRQEIVSALSGNRVDGVSVYNANGDVSAASVANHHEEA